MIGTIANILGFNKVATTLALSGTVIVILFGLYQAGWYNGRKALKVEIKAAAAEARAENVEEGNEVLNEVLNSSDDDLRSRLSDWLR